MKATKIDYTLSTNSNRETNDHSRPALILRWNIHYDYMACFPEYHDSDTSLEICLEITGERYGKL